MLPDVATVMANLPARSTRAERREAQRRAMAERIASLPPPADPVMGSVMPMPVQALNGGLLVQGRPLLGSGQPLLVPGKAAPERGFGGVVLMAMAADPGKARARISLRTLYQPTVVLAMALMAVIAMMILPMPAFVLDMGLAVSFGIAILIFTITLFIPAAARFLVVSDDPAGEPDAQAVAQRVLDQAHHRAGETPEPGPRAR